MARLLCCLLLLAALLPGWAGGGPAGYVVVYDQDDPVSVAVANHYQRARNIPERNMIPLAFPATLNGGNAWKVVEALRAAIAEHGMGEQLQGIALAGYLPLGAPVGSGSGQVSLASMLYDAPNCTDLKVFPRMASNAAYHLPPAAPTTCLNAYTPQNGQRYWPTSHVGPTDRAAMSPRAALEAIDAATAADGAKPDGVIYWPLNGDIRSTTREFEIAQVRPVWEAMGIKYSVLDGVWLRGRGDIAGGVVGIAVTEAAADNRYLPGAWVDHLTSYGGVLWDNWQMPCTDFLLAGAAGSSGTMGEPYAIAGKFPHAHIYTHFRNGASLAEAFWQSIQTTCEILPVGDPLMQPYATFPTVTITMPKRGATVSGTVKIAVSTTGAIEPNLELVIDGRRVTATRVAGGFTLDTTALADGWHELRVIACAAIPVRTEGEAVLPLLVANRKQALRLTGPATAAYDAPLTLTVAADNLPNIAGITLRANGRTLATATAAGPVTIPARALPYTGACAIYAAATLADGATIAAAPLAVTVAWPPAKAQTAALGIGMATARYFAATTEPGFAWDGAATAELPLAESACQNRRLTCAVSSILGKAQPEWAVGIAKKPGLELTAWFQAPADDIYEFDLSPGGEVAVDGAVLTAQRNKLLGPVPLAAGWHALRVRVVIPDAKATVKLQLRGGPVTKLNELPIAWLAAPAAADAPPAPKIAIVKADGAPVSNAPVIVTGTKVLLTVEGAADLRYNWTAVAAPAVGTVNHPDTMADVAFAPAAGRETTATFAAAGAYLLRVRAENGAASAVADVRVTVQPVATSVAVTAGRASVFAGYPVDLYATVQDQFKRRMPNAPPVAWTAAMGACTAISGETARFRAGAEAGPCAITATAVGKTGTLALTVKPSQPPVLRMAPGFNQFGQANIVNLYAQAEDPQDTKNRDLTVKWSVEQAPPGQTLEFTAAQASNTPAKLSGPGEYRVRYTATNPAGSTTAALTITAAARDDGTLVYAPMARIASAPCFITQMARLFVTGYTGPSPTVAWETSTDNGATWQPAPNGDQLSLMYGPTTEADLTRLFRVTVRNAVAAMTSEPAKAILTDPKGGLISADRAPILAGLNATSVTVTLHRTRHTAGKATLDYTLTPFYPTVPEKRAKAGVDYTDARGTVSWDDGDAADKTITIALPARPGAAGRGFMVQVMKKDGDIGQLVFGIPVWLPSAEEPEGPK